MAGNGPTNTNPIFASDEDFWIRCRADYGAMSTSSEQLAVGSDGSFAVGFPWVLNSASVNFQNQGVAAQCVVQITGPKPWFTGSTGRFFAVDSVLGTACTLRVIGKALGVGNPPVPSTVALSNVTFICNTFQTLLEDASWDLKSRFTIDENLAYRASNWIYQGLEDPYRDLRAATVLQALCKAYQAEVRADRGDWAFKAQRINEEYRNVLERVQIKWGPLGSSAEPSTIFSGKVSR